MKGSIPKALDLLTGLLFLGALYLFMRPEGMVGAKWQQVASDRAMRRDVSGQWNDLVVLSQPLSRAHMEYDIIEFSDYECPFCRRSSPAVDSVVALGMGVGYIHMPLPAHPRAPEAALLALCAPSAEFFQTLHDLLMRDGAWQKEADFSRIRAALHDGNDQVIDVCMRSDSTKSLLARHSAIATSLRVTGTPTFVSRTGIHRGLATVADLKGLLVQ